MRYCAGVLSLALLLASCGGGDSATQSGVALPPTSPSPSPSASPTPAPSGTSLAPSSIGLTLQQDYVTLGFSQTVVTYPDDGVVRDEVSEWDDESPIAFSYFSGRGRFEIGIPALGRRELTPCEAINQDAVHCFAGEEPVSRRRLGASLLRPDSAVLPLRSTSLVHYGTSDGPTVSVPTTLYEGVFAYGVPTPANRVPVSGVAEARAVIGALSQVPCLLRIDFNKRTIEGDFSFVVGPNEYVPDDVATTYDISLTGTIGPDGKISGSFGGDAVDGMFEGYLTGADADELMLRMKYAISHRGTIVTYRNALAGKVL